MVDATVHVIDRGSLERDLNYMMEGHTLGTHDEPNSETDYGEIPVWNLVIDHPEGTILRDTGSHHDALDGHWPEPLWQAFYSYDADEHRLDDDLDEAGFGIDDTTTSSRPTSISITPAGWSSSTAPTCPSSSTSGSSSCLPQRQNQRRKHGLRPRGLRSRPQLAAAPPGPRTSLRGRRVRSLPRPYAGAHWNGNPPRRGNARLHRRPGVSGAELRGGDPARRGIALGKAALVREPPADRGDPAETRRGGRLRLRPRAVRGDPRGVGCMSYDRSVSADPPSKQLCYYVPR